LFETNLAGIVIFDAAGHIIDCNDAWPHMVGYDDANEIKTRNIEEFCVNSPCRKTVCDALEHPCNLQVRETELHRKDGSLVWVICNCTVISPAKAPLLIQATAVDINASKLAQQAFQESEEHFRILVEQAPDGIFIADAQGRYLDVNSAGAEMLGYTREEILRLSISEVVSPEEIARVREEREILHSGQPTRREWKFRRKDNSCFFGEVVGRRLPDGRLQGILRDISERKQAEETIRKNEQRFRVALHRAPITVFTQDRDLRYTWLYHPHLYRDRTVLGKTDAEILGPETASRLTELKQRVLTTGTPVRKEVVILLDGRNYSVDLTLEPLVDEEGNIIGITGASLDIGRLRELAKSLEHSQQRLKEEKSYLKKQLESELGFEKIIGQSSALSDVLQQVRVVAPTDSSVLLLGETGTGKGLVAHSIHQLSKRKDENFIELNCAAVPTGLLESELFGYEKGAFTGAANQKVGRLELTDKGTLFLDEVGELPSQLQPKLLRVLQDREFERLGGNRTIRVDVRIISATNRDLHKDVADKRFREDLFYRLNVFPLELPPLRERRSDIPALAHHFVAKHAARMGKHIEQIPDETMGILENWNWPGNIRELENLLERMVILTRNNILAPPPPELSFPSDGAEDNLVDIEREHIIRVLHQTHGRLSGADGASRRLAVKRTTLQSMLKRFHIDLREFRDPAGTVG
jgi:PAS domain S-box-containing protein